MKKLIQRVNLKQQWKSDEKKILPVIKKILRSGNYVGSNIILDREKKIANYCGTKYAICTNSGTDALTLGLHLLNVKRGDEVITPTNSFLFSLKSTLSRILFFELLYEKETFSSSMQSYKSNLFLINFSFKKL